MKNKLAYILIIASFLPISNTSADTAILAGGCFWCMESDFEKLEGVLDVVSGFTGGELKNPTYRGNHEGHYEAVKISYDPNVVDYKGILKHYWVNIDPFNAKGQFCDNGHSYLSAIFVANKAERDIAKSTRQAVVNEFPNQKVITPILAQSTFYPIKGEEIGHQNYYKNNPIRYNLYRFSCGRDRRLKQIWGDRVTQH